jgi:hypothetical protein
MKPIHTLPIRGANPTVVKMRFADASKSSPPPCGAGIGVGVVRRGTAVRYCTTPIPPPQGGESRAAAANRIMAPVSHWFAHNNTSGAQ